MRKFAFTPVVNKHTRVLVLGSLPGEASLRAQRYYAHPQNLFWQLVGAAIGREDLPTIPYETRLEVLLSVGIGLWDTVASALRTGSLDSAIREADHAPLAELAGALPHLRAIGFNGKTSSKIGRQQLAGTDFALIDLPSTSPAYASLKYSEKRERWLQLKQFLG